MLHYNYIIFMSSDYNKVAYMDIKDNDQVIFINGHYQSSNRFEKICYRLHHSRKVNQLVHLPFKQYWFPRYGNWVFFNDKPICFLFDGRFMQYDYYREYVSYLKKKYPSCKCVCIYNDRMITYTDIITNKRILPNQFPLLDLQLSYSPKDAAEYHLLYHPTVFSNVVVPPSDLPETDVYFLGGAKDRLNDILAIYDQLTRCGYCCDFHITKVPIEKQVHKKGITYNQPMTYMQNLQHVVKAKYLLELMAGEADGCSFRTWEAMRYNKILLTNNQSVLQTPFYDAKKCIMIDKKWFLEDDKEHSWIEALPDYDLSTPWHTQPKTPMDLLRFIDSKI